MSAARPDDHRYFEGLAVAHVLGGLDESDGRMFRAHLLDCPDCRARVGELRAIAHDLADVERDERRQRAAKAIETKRREVDPDASDEREVLVPSRASRILVLVGLGLVILLSAWNFSLREANDRLQVVVADQQRAAEILEFGTPWTVIEQNRGDAPGLQVAAKEHNGKLALVVEGLDDTEIYSLFARNADNAVVDSMLMIQPVDGRILELVQVPADATELLLTDPPGAPTSEPNGPRVFRAFRPPQEMVGHEA